MRRFLLLFAFVSLSFVSQAAEPYRPLIYPQRDTVFICNNGKTAVYHTSKRCNAFVRCTHEVLYVTKEDAVKKYGLRQCHTCG